MGGFSRGFGSPFRGGFGGVSGGFGDGFGGAQNKMYRYPASELEVGGVMPSGLSGTMGGMGSGPGGLGTATPINTPDGMPSMQNPFNPAFTSTPALFADRLMESVSTRAPITKQPIFGSPSDITATSGKGPAPLPGYDPSRPVSYTNYSFRTLDPYSRFTNSQDAYNQTIAAGQSQEYRDLYNAMPPWIRSGYMAPPASSPNDPNWVYAARQAQNNYNVFGPGGGFSPTPISGAGKNLDMGDGFSKFDLVENLRRAQGRFASPYGIASLRRYAEGGKIDYADYSSKYPNLWNTWGSSAQDTYNRVMRLGQSPEYRAYWNSLPNHLRAYAIPPASGPNDPNWTYQAGQESNQWTVSQGSDPFARGAAGSSAKIDELMKDSPFASFRLNTGVTGDVIAPLTPEEERRISIATPAPKPTTTPVPFTPLPGITKPNRDTSGTGGGGSDAKPEPTPAPKPTTTPVPPQPQTPTVPSPQTPTVPSPQTPTFPSTPLPFTPPPNITKPGYSSSTLKLGTPFIPPEFGARVIPMEAQIMQRMLARSRSVGDRAEGQGIAGLMK